MITCVGIKGNRYLIQESEPNIVLNFIGEDSHRFEQSCNPLVNPKEGPMKMVDFSLTVDYLRNEFPGFLIDDRC